MSENAVALVNPLPASLATEDARILQCLNLNLQVKVHNLENEICRLKKEIQSHKGKNAIYESLTKDLASLRVQFDKTAAALLRKCEAYDTLKKEFVSLTAKRNASPKSASRSKFCRDSPAPVSNFKSKLALYEEMDCASSDDERLPKKSVPGRSSMGSCGNITAQIVAEEAIPSHMKQFAAPIAPLRNKLLIKLHSLKAASTESLESTGRKSMRSELKQKSIKCPSALKKINGKTNLDNSLQSTKNTSGNAVIKAPPSIRPALSQANGRLIKLTNSTAPVKRTNSNVSNKSGSTKPAFRL